MRRETVFKTALTALVLVMVANVAFLVYSAVPNGTVRTVGGVTTYVGDYGNFSRWWQGTTERLDAAGNLAVTTVNTGQGANELYAMDQNVLATSDVDFSSVNLTGLAPIMLNGTIIEPDTLLYPISGVDFTLTISGADYICKNGRTGAVWVEATALAAAQHVAGGGVVALKNGFPLSQTFAGITDNAATVRYTIVIGGYIEDDHLITAKSYIDVVGGNVNVNTATNGHAVTMNSLVSCEWRDITVRRNGAVTGASHVFNILGTSDSTVRLTNVRALNEIVAAVNSCYGIVTDGSSSPTITGSTAIGGGGGTSCHGIFTVGSSSPTINGGTFTGGGGGNGCYGIYTASSSSPTINGGTFTGGGGGNSCYGIYTAGSSSPTITGSTGIGGGGGTTGYGIYAADGSSPQISNSVGIGGSRTNWWWTYASADNGRFQPYAAHPYILVGVYVQVTAAAAGGTTLDLGTSIGGNETATGILIDSTGAKYFAIANVEVAAGSYMYATPSAGIAEGSLSVRYVVMTNYATCYGGYINTVGAARLAECTLLANGASDALYITDVAEAANTWRVTNSHLETLDPANQRSLITQSAYDPCPIYNCFLKGLVVNAVPPAGTAVGSNVQNSNYKSLTTETYTDWKIAETTLTRWKQLVDANKIPDTIRFTAKPLQSLLDLPEDATKQQRGTVTAENALRIEENTLLAAEAKPLSVILAEWATPKTP